MIVLLCYFLPTHKLENIMTKPFWKEKTLEQMTTQEWESLCDGCALCCHIRLEDEDTGELVQTNISCKYLDLGTCKCTDYQNRSINVPDCIKVTAKNIPQLHWMPESCAYRLLSEGRELYDWHPLVSGDPESVHKAGISFLGEIVSEEDIEEGYFNNL